MSPANACHLAHQRGLNPCSVDELVQLLLGSADAVSTTSWCSPVPLFAASARRSSSYFNPVCY